MRRLIVGPFLEILIDGDIVGEDDGYARVGCRAVERDALSGFLASQPEVTRGPGDMQLRARATSATKATFLTFF